MSLIRQNEIVFVQQKVLPNYITKVVYLIVSNNATFFPTMLSKNYFVYKKISYTCNHNNYVSCP